MTAIGLATILAAVFVGMFFTKQGAVDWRDWLFFALIFVGSALTVIGLLIEIWRAFP